MAIVTTNGSSEGVEKHTVSSPSTAASSSLPAEKTVPPPTHDVSATKDDDTNNDIKSFVSLKERSRIPPSFFVTFGSIFLLQFLSGLWSLQTLTSWYSSMRTSLETLRDLAQDCKVSMQETLLGSSSTLEDALTLSSPWQQRGQVLLWTLLVVPCVYVFFVAPFRAGLWTGPRARRHKFHRYMGLAYMVQYTLAWVELLTNYTAGGSTSVVPHFLALNGILQASSAYVSFKVLPTLEDSGYLSDKAVMSRNFVHENIFFTLMCIFGSVYYFEPTRTALRSTLVGRILENIFMFWPYILIRTWYPITRFKDAGKTHKGRTDANLNFYKIATTMVKIFFLWAKYFLGFYMNFLIFLDLVPPDHETGKTSWRFLHGMFLLNTGTVSLGVFLHTLRFRKVLPPRVTMSIYLLQIYATFSAIPLAFDLFYQHPRLCGVALAGLLCNMTRSRLIHGIWCFGTMVLLNTKGIQW